MLELLPLPPLPELELPPSLVVLELSELLQWVLLLEVLPGLPVLAPSVPLPDLLPTSVLLPGLLLPPSLL